MAENSPQAVSPEPQGEGNSRGGPSSTIWMLLVVLLVYPLSIGPAAHLAKKFPATEGALEVAYLPVVALAHQVPLLERALRWYIVDVWRYPAPPQ